MAERLRIEQTAEGGSRGVFEEDDTLPGMREIRVRPSRGKAAIVVLAREGWIDEGILQELKRILDCKDPADNPAQTSLPLRLIK